MKLKVIQNFGLILFFLGFGTWLISFGLEKYVLTEDVIENVLTSDHVTEFNNQSRSVLKREYSNSFEMVSDLKSVFSHINDDKIEEFKISEDKIGDIIDLNDIQSFSFQNSSTAFDHNDIVEKYQFEKLKSWGAWLEGSSFSSREELKSSLTSVSNNITRWAIISDQGYNSYVVDDLVYRFAKTSSKGPISSSPVLFLLISYGLTILGAVLYIVPKQKTEGLPGVKNNNVFKDSLKSKGWLGILLGTFLILFYVLLYFFPEYMTAWIIMIDPMSYLLKGAEASRFFLYGFIYTLTILVMGIRMIIKYRHSRYQIYRSISVMFFQLAFAFLIPEILMRLNQPYFDFKNIWPLDYDFFFDYELDAMIQNGSLGLFMLGWGIGLSLIGVPVMVYFFGKRWYCSWVCGCGGLAETLGDPFRQLSDKSIKAWKFERYSIHAVLVFAILMTAGVLYTYWTGNDNILGINTYSIRSIYGGWIGAGFAGVVGTGFYPIMGNRVWCRFGCPLAAYLGLVQRFKSRFRITTNGGQCISCGNCSTYCEMGIDVRWYAQRGQNIIRSSCVGCGVCASVCPRGVLNLENRSDDNRFESAGLIGNNSFPEINKG
ncbi:MAG: 4Fe-4S binding protein [Reichenbachiella sp.]